MFELCASQRAAERNQMSLTELIGNSRIKATLASYLRNQRIPSSMIFIGSDAYHQLLFALNFAKAALCQNKINDSCDRCRPCQAIDHGLFPDVQILKPDGQFYRKNQLDELIASAYQRPLQAEKRFFILRDAQSLNEMAANAFLKTLEEPLPTNVFILLASNMNLILPTIQSRCQILKFLPLSKNEIRLELEQKGVDPEKSRLLAFFSSNSLENVAEVDWQELEEKRSAMLNILDRLLRQSEVEDILLDLYDRSRSRESFIAYFREMVNLISVLLRDIMILMVDGENTTLINLDYKEKLMELAALTNIDKIFYLIRKMEFLLRDIQRNLNARVLVLEFINSYAPETAIPAQGSRPLGG
jgi:DNA polymerase-3 subunit delta'